MKRIVVTLTAVAALAAMATSAQAAIVYEKGGKLYAAGNSGKNAKLIVQSGRWPGLTPDGQTVLYSNSSNAIFALPIGGGTPVRLAATDCRACFGTLAPDNKSIAFHDGKGATTRVPLDGTPSTPLATGVDGAVSFSPDSSQIVFGSFLAEQSDLFTVPASGGTPVKLASSGTFSPLWTNAGIVATKFKAGKRPQALLVLLDAGGNVQRTLARTTYPSQKALQSDVSVEIPLAVAGANIVTWDADPGDRLTLRLVSPRSGIVKATRHLRDSSLESVSTNGKTILILRKGKLQSVSFKTGKRTTLVKTGVKSAEIN